MTWVWITYPREGVEIQHARITSCTTSPLSLANRKESARVAGGTRNAAPSRQRLLGACLSRAAERNVGFRDRREGSARECGPLAGRGPSRTYRAGCVSTVVSHRLRGWLGESVPQQSARRVTQGLLNRLVAGACYLMIYQT